ncbi:MAG: SpoIIE family protein phosphatase [Candidatus Sumerlaeia bacterium]|nr:SpoIIE family protein phosphatase [Candidatus Sumerlaeia bacterium]
MRILVAEDDRTSRMLLSMTLRNMGHQVVECDDGEKAWALILEEGGFPIVITDWEMPHLNGLELCQKIRAHQRELYYTFVLLLTVREGKESLLEAFQAGADEFLSKPIDRAELHARIHSANRILELESKLRRQYRELQSAHEMIKKDLRAAARVQQSLLPRLEDAKSLPFKVSWNLIPCEELAGDIFNVVPLGENRWGIYLLDVSGHGVASSLLSVTLSRLLSAERDHSALFGRVGSRWDVLSPAQVLSNLNQRFQISAESEGQYFTIVYGILNTQTRTFKFSSAGHPPLIQQQPNGEVKIHESGQLPIGFLPDLEFKDKILSLIPGERLLLYSDGVVELANRAGELLGTNRVTEELGKSRSTEFSQVLPSLENALTQWCGCGEEVNPQDDISLLLIEL